MFCPSRLTICPSRFTIFSSSPTICSSSPSEAGTGEKISTLSSWAFRSSFSAVISWSCFSRSSRVVTTAFRLSSVIRPRSIISSQSKRIVSNVFCSSTFSPPALSNSTSSSRMRVSRSCVFISTSCFSIDNRRTFLRDSSNWCCTVSSCFLRIPTCCRRAAIVP